MSNPGAVKFVYIMEEVEGRVKGLFSLESNGDRDLTTEEQIGALRIAAKAANEAAVELEKSLG